MNHPGEHTVASLQPSSHDRTHLHGTRHHVTALGSAARRCQAPRRARGVRPRVGRRRRAGQWRVWAVVARYCIYPCTLSFMARARRGNAWWWSSMTELRLHIQLLFTTQLTNEAETLALAPPPSPLALRRARAVHAPVQAAPRPTCASAPLRGYPTTHRRDYGATWFPPDDPPKYSPVSFAQPQALRSVPSCSCTTTRGQW